MSLVFFREGLGSFFGTVGGPIKDPDPAKPKYRERTKPAPEKMTFKIKPPKKGTGYGYIIQNFSYILLRSVVALVVFQI